MNIHAILTLNDKSDPLIEDFKFNGLNLNEIKLQSQVFSLPPLYKHFIKRTEELVQIDANGNLGNPHTSTFIEVDACVLFARFLRDLQNFLNKTATTPADKASAISEDVTKILQAKKTLVSNIATGLRILADTTDPGESRALSMASEAFKKYLDANITTAYLANVLLQFEVSQPGNNQSTKYIDSPIKTDRPVSQKSTKGIFTLVQETDTYQSAAAITQGTFLQNKNLNLSYPIEVPIPLNAPPAPLVLVKRDALQASPDGTQIVKELALWNYNITFIMPQAAQDQVIIDINFNASQAADLVNTAAIAKDLFSALAQYEFVANALWKILEADKSTTPSPQYVNAVKTLAYLTENIVNYWSVRLPEPSPEIASVVNTAGEIKHQFTTRSTYNESGQLKSITLSAISGNNETIAWPALSIQSTSGPFIPLIAEKLTEHAVLYAIPEETSITQVIQLSLLAPHFEKASVAAAQLKTVRNQELIPGITTNPAFVLLSDIVTIAPVSPTYVFDKPIDITKSGSNFTTELQAFFAQLFGAASDGKVVSIEVSYLHPISIDSEGNKGPMIQIPVAMVPPTSLSSATAVDVAKFAEEWFATTKPPIDGAEWALALKVFEEGDPDSIILSIGQLVYQVAN